jgi:PIN domain nuclease of toxin-antitoxin system
MKIIIDTHFFLWWLAFPEELTIAEKALLSDPKHTVFVSAVSIWEIVIKQAIGKLDVPTDIYKFIERNDFVALSFTVEHANFIASLPTYHDDPFDRMLIAQTQAEKAVLLTRDKKIHPYASDALPSIPAALVF